MRWSYWDTHTDGNKIWNNIEGTGIIRVTNSALIFRNFKLYVGSQYITKGEDYAMQT